MALRNWNSGIRMLWYGMNMPKSSKAKMTFAPRNFHFESTYPFSEPSSAESAVAGTTSRTELKKAGASTSKAEPKASRVGALGSSQSVDRETSVKDFSDVTTMANMGSRKNTASAMSSTSATTVVGSQRVTGRGDAPST